MVLSAGARNDGDIVRPTWPTLTLTTQAYPSAAQSTGLGAGTRGILHKRWATVSPSHLNGQEENLWSDAAFISCCVAQRVRIPLPTFRAKITISLAPAVIG